MTATTARLLRASRARRLTDRGFGYSRDLEPEPVAVPAGVLLVHFTGRRQVAS